MLLLLSYLHYPSTILLFNSVRLCLQVTLRRDVCSGGHAPGAYVHLHILACPFPTSSGLILFGKHMDHVAPRLGLDTLHVFLDFCLFCDGVSVQVTTIPDQIPDEPPRFVTGPRAAGYHSNNLNVNVKEEGEMKTHDVTLYFQNVSLTML